MIQLFAADLDGTLLNFLHTVDGTILSSIRRITDAGAHFVVATGRTMRSNTEFGFEGNIAVICSNGSIIFSESDELLHHVPIDKAFLEELMRTFPDICLEAVGVRRSYVRGTREQREAGFRRDNPLRAIIMRGMRAKMNRDCCFEQTIAQVLAHDICKINARVSDPGVERELHDFLSEHADHVVNAPFNPVMFEITARLANKGTAVAWLADHYGIPGDEIAVYGDGGNDIEMLTRFSNSYATSNGSEAAKRAAGAVIGSCVFHAVPRHMMRTLATERARTAVERKKDGSEIRCQRS
ncbi:HAD-superfamily hydrolase, subfamily IIB [Coriobacterium glomerans PW2]|uniref:HAD-superfamily hydrolase, subfamily IIB n=1 Tax=Coriobacterium glomerans (strain ATCC 49209 / DSM 20642 / JCM 10262 / PW2) TaxID=700015 RepID=F2N752_CORGP|nr:HAD family hydrolase [Coriobacterium glomerans]AEB06391.1 HAD-superfamily hydrolase, subfamily IIB [Coriobacterium glomerans PW2]